MIKIIRPRESGKAKELLAAAQELNAIILTEDKRGFKVKAASYGYSDIDIIDIDDLLWRSLDEDKPILIHNIEKFLTSVFPAKFGYQCEGFSATLEEL